MERIVSREYAGTKGEGSSCCAATPPARLPPGHCRFSPDASLREVPLAPRLDCSPGALGEDKELWLIQLPLEVRRGSGERWAGVSGGAGRGVKIVFRV